MAREVREFALGVNVDQKGPNIDLRLADERSRNALIKKRQRTASVANS